MPIYTEAEEKKFIDGLGTHSPNRGKFHTHLDWLRLYIGAHDHPGLEKWRSNCLAYAKKRLGELIHA